MQPDDAPWSPRRTDPPARLRTIHDAFADPCKRAVLADLQGRDAPADVTAVARRIAARCRDAPAVAGDPDPGAARSWLLHDHLLDMAAAGLVDYDPETDAVELPPDVCVAVDAPDDAGAFPDWTPTSGE